MTQPTGAEIPERYARWYATACDPEHSDYSAKTATLIEDVARLEAELAEAKAGWDSCIANLREAAEICKGVERQRDEARAQIWLPWTAVCGTETVNFAIDKTDEWEERQDAARSKGGDHE